MTTKTERESAQLTHDGETWELRVGRYRASWPVCTCELTVCTCNRPPVRTWARAGSHERTHCHRGHAEHMAVKLRQILFGRTRR